MLKVVKTVSEVKLFLGSHSKKGVKIGFVPTMGALHAGHISLINRAKAENDLVFCSIFVNPAQFTNKKDLLNYTEADYQLLSKAGCDLLFEPSVSEIYPEEKDFDMDFGELEQVMEGKYRPGHFKGVAKVVSRLFEIMEPYQAYFGEKDFQQLAIIREMVRRTGMNVKVVGCPTLRDERGLALSSRNIHLTPEEFQFAPIIFETLQKSRDTIIETGIIEAKKKLISIIQKHNFFKVQYLEFVNAQTLLPITEIDSKTEQRVCIAVLTTNTRLIDNAPL